MIAEHGATASKAAETFILELEAGAFRLGSRNKQEEKAKEKKKPSFILMSVLLLVCLLYFHSIVGTHKIQGFAVLSDQRLFKSQKLVFYNLLSKKKYVCNTSQDAEFCIRLPNGDYKVYGIGKDIQERFQNENSSLINLSVSCSTNYRITVSN